jgi:hypothetical protein
MQGRAIGISSRGEVLTESLATVFCPNTELCTSLADVDRLADAIEVAALIA